MDFSFLHGYLLPCAYKAWFGFNCPICGFQRSLILLLQGDFIASFKQYPPLIPLLFLIGVALLWLIRRRWITPRFFKTASLVVLILVMINYGLEFVL